MLAGEPPFTASTGAALIAKRFSSPTPSVRGKRPDVSPMVDQALQQALSLRAHDRFATIQEFSRAVTMTSATPSSASTAALPAVPTPSGTVPAITAPKRVSPAVVAVGLLAVVVLGALLFRRGGTASPSDPAAASAAPVAAGPTRLVVLPFENLGDTADAYFAEGIADELRGKLTSVPGLEVIARASSVQYKGSSKSQAEIAKELGVRYLLTGTVRWEKSGGGKGRVRVSPELIEVSPNGAPASKWQQPFDAPITDVFQVQGDIAGKVASALNVALGAGEQQKLAAQPTQNLAAYQAFLQGEAASQGMSDNAGVTLRVATGFYEQAAALDGGFMLAWSRIARARSGLYFGGQPTPENREKAEAAAKRALALGPNEAEAHHALGAYYQLVLADPNRAKAELDRAVALDPRNVDVLASLAQVEQSLGNWEAALGHLQQASAIDPRSRNTARRVAQAQLWTRRLDEALVAWDAALSLAPGSAQMVEGKAMVYLAKGDLAGARAVIKASSADVSQDRLVYYFSNYWDLFWVLDEAQQKVLQTMGPDAFDDNRGAWALVQAQVRHLHGDQAGTVAYADSARASFGTLVKSSPNDAQSFMLQGLSLAYMGRGPEAIKVAEYGMTLETSDVGYSLPYYRLLYIRTLILAGDHAKAVGQLRELLARPFYISRDWLRIDPAFDPLRKNPAFQQLLTEK
jgi:TolB-like protein/thioredoxin-like negative regulator of GroEL